MYKIREIILSRIFLFGTLVSTLLFVNCNKAYKTPEEIENIAVNLSIERFEQQFFKLDVVSLSKLKSKYPYLFPSTYPESFWLQKSNDTIQLGLKEEVTKVYPNVRLLKEELTQFYKHLLYYYPQIKVPEVITITNDVDYKNSVIQGKEKLLIALDCYLGSDHEFYQNMSGYIAEGLSKENIVIDVAEVYARKIVGRNSERNFVGQIIHYGKQLYLTNAFVPFRYSSQVLRYTEDQWKWAEANEKFTWQYLIDKEILFGTDKNLASRFIQEAPFTKFYLDFDAETPPRLGQYIGFKIVEAFMQHNKVSLQQLVELDSKYIFEHSKYKPKK